MNQAAKPFRATYYNPEKVKDLAKVVCPPYDVIDRKKESFLKKQSPYNYCRATLAAGSNYDIPVKNLENWLKEKILIKDKTPNYYLYQRIFESGQKKFFSYGIFCLLNMKKKEIFPHEYTLDKPKEDRKKMISKTKANLSPVFVVAGGTNDFLGSIFKKKAKKKPFFQFKDQQNCLNRVWKVASRQDALQIASGLHNSYLVIADGHHRFETAFDYYQKNKGKFKDLNYVLAYVALAQPGLLILPTHRIITSSANNKNNFNRLKNDFKLELISQKRLTKKLKQAKGFSFGVYINGKFYFASLKKGDFLGKIRPSVYEKLDSYIFHEKVLPKLTYKKIEYSHSIDEVKKYKQKNKIAFLLKAASLGAVFGVARAGYKLPQKSTYFYPKILSGVLMRRFEK